MKYDASKKIKMIIVNSITSIRLIGAFVLPIIYYFSDLATFALWTIIFFTTDCFDGFLARKWKVSTFFGAALDALSDKLLNTCAFILLSLKYNAMLLPLVLEIAIIYTIYSTYRYGGNVKASIIGKIKAIILDICVIFSFCILSLPIFNSNSNIILYFINKTNEYISLFSCIITIVCIFALLDYINKNKIARSNPKSLKIKYEHKEKKSFDRIKKEIFDTSYYLKHKDESILRQLYK